jgi:hypothetical protein
MVKTSAAMPARGLSRFLHAPDGLTEPQAIDTANVHVEAMRAEIEADIAQLIDEVGAAIRAAAEKESGPDLRELHRVANSIYSVAESFGCAGLGKVAYSMCRLVDLLGEFGRRDTGAIRLHYDAMRMLGPNRRLPVEAENILISGLGDVTAHLESMLTARNSTLGASAP